MTTKKTSKKESPNVLSHVKTHGERLRDLADWYGRSYEEFAKHIKKSKGWLFSAFKNERVPLKDQISICRTFNIPAAYFEGLYELPLKMEETSSVARESSEIYQTRNDKEVISLQTEIITRDKQIIELQQEVLRLTRLLQQK